GRWPSCGVAEKARIGRALFRSEDDPPAAKPATPLLSLRWTFRAKRACVVITDAEPDRLAPLTPPAPIGLRGVWVVAARYCASPPARCCADALERSFACPSANLRAPSRRGLHPRSVRRRPAAVSPRGERIRSRRGCWHCCVDRAAPPSPPSRAPPAGNRTRCAPSWPPWCARSSGSGWSRRRRTASACIGLLPARLPPMPRGCRVRSHAGALDKPGRDRGRELAKPMNGINAPQRPDCVADDAVSCELVSTPNSLLTGKLTGNFAESGHPRRFPHLINELIQRLAGKFPTQRNREFLQP